MTHEEAKALIEAKQLYIDARLVTDIVLMPSHANTEYILLDFCGDMYLGDSRVYKDGRQFGWRPVQSKKMPLRQVDLGGKKIDEAYSQFRFT